jgi:hypothetical protein
MALLPARYSLHPEGRFQQMQGMGGNPQVRIGEGGNRETIGYLSHPLKNTLPRKVSSNPLRQRSVRGHAFDPKTNH